MDIKIKTVIELSPSDYTDKEYEYPDGTYLEFSEGWNEHWQKSLKDSDINDITPCILGQSFAETSKISDKTLDIIIQKHLEDTEIENLDEIGQFEGGFVILVDNEPILEPQCCSSISDYKNWNTTLSNISDVWKQVWIGHPMVYIKASENKICFSKLTESNKPENIIANEIKLIDFKNQLSLANEDIKIFNLKVTESLKRLGYESSTKIANILINDEY